MTRNYELADAVEEQIPFAFESDESDGLQPKPSRKKRVIACVVGLALFAVISFAAWAKMTSVPGRQGNVDASVELAEKATSAGTTTTTTTASTWWIIKHEFKHADDAKPWWDKAAKVASDKKASAKWKNSKLQAGWANTLFLPTAEEGPIYCVWQGRANATKKDVEDFINTNELSPALGMINEVMPINLTLSYGILPGTPVDLGRRLAAAAQGGDSKSSDDEVSSTFYLTVNRFSSAKDSENWWKMLAKSFAAMKAFENFIDDIAKEGYWHSLFFPTSAMGPIYCLWEAKSGKTLKDVDALVQNLGWPFPKNETLESNQMIKTLPIPLTLLGGIPPVKPYFK